jgi:hypothetical protein
MNRRILVNSRPTSKPKLAIKAGDNITFWDYATIIVTNITNVPQYWKKYLTCHVRYHDPKLPINDLPVKRLKVLEFAPIPLPKSIQKHREKVAKREAEKKRKAEAIAKLIPRVFKQWIPKKKKTKNGVIYFKRDFYNLNISNLSEGNNERIFGMLSQMYPKVYTNLTGFSLPFINGTAITNMTTPISALATTVSEENKTLGLDDVVG